MVETENVCKWMPVIHIGVGILSGSRPEPIVDPIAEPQIGNVALGWTTELNPESLID